MSSDQLEKMSAFMDAEANRFELKGFFKEMLQNEDHLRCWERYHLIRDVLRGDLPPAVNPVFANALMRKLGEEPGLDGAAINPRWYKPAAGMALAASVAAVSVLGINAFISDETGSGPVVVADAPDKAAPAEEPVVVEKREPTAQPLAPASIEPPSELRRVALSPFEQASYLANHSQYAGGPASVPHLRLVVTDIRSE